MFLFIEKLQYYLNFFWQLKKNTLTYAERQYFREEKYIPSKTC